MAAIQYILKNVNCFIDGYGQAGSVSEIAAVKRVLKTEELLAGGMFTPVEITLAMEKMEAEFTLMGYNPTVLTTFGVIENNRVPFTIKGWMEDFDGTQHALTQNLTGKVKGLDAQTWKPGAAAPLKVTVALAYFKETIDGVVIDEIDAVNMIYSQNGVDQLAGARAALGI